MICMSEKICVLAVFIATTTLLHSFSLPSLLNRCSQRELVNFRAIGIESPSRKNLILLAKKKRTVAGSIDLEELEAQEKLLFGDEDFEGVPDASPKKGKKEKNEKTKRIPSESEVDSNRAVQELPLEADTELYSEPNQNEKIKGKRKKNFDTNTIRSDALSLVREENVPETTSDKKNASTSKVSGSEIDEPKNVTTEKSKKQKKKTKNSSSIDERLDFDDDFEMKSKTYSGDVRDSDIKDTFDDDLEIADDPNQETLEEKVRKTRPPPRIRISENVQPGFVSMRLDGVAVTFKNQEVLREASWEVKTGDRIGLVGPNGGGKTTQMKILAGELEPTTGEVILSSSDLRVAFLRQEFIDELVLEQSLKEEMRSVFKEELRVLAEIHVAEKDISDPNIQSDADKMEEVISRLTSLQEEAGRLKAYDIDTKVEKVMNMMGFIPSEGDALVSSFSGGWRMRIGMGKILLRDPNILLLDEPTNHLDLESVEWLEQFLQSQNIPMVIVSHDREFLDRVCTKMVDTEGGVALTYNGNYSQFLKLKKARLEAMESAYQNQQKKIAEDRAWINQFKNKGSFGSQIKSREKAIERMLTGPDAVSRPPKQSRPFVFRFPSAPRVNDMVVALEGVTHSYEDQFKPLLKDINLLVERNQRIAFLGPNGAGKSTLLRLIMGFEEPSGGGKSRFGISVISNYFQQNQADALDLDKTVVQVIEESSSGQSYNELRKLLGQFLFKGDTVHKKIGQLSGGEKARVSLCLFMLRPANLLVLDEPTNHLDIPAKEMLEEALQHFDGAVLLVSHDRYFVSQVANTICVLENGELKRYEGDYRYYLDQNESLLEKVESRYVDGLTGISKAKVVDLSEMKEKKSFGGKGGPSGDKTKGIKNAKRMKK